MASVTAADAIDAFAEARERTLALVSSVSDGDLERVHSTLMSPLVWDLGHIAAFEDLWLVHRYGDQPMLRDDLADVYDAFETPRAGRGELPFLGPDAARDYLDQVRLRMLEVIDERGVGNGRIHEMVLRHEHQHNETMLQTLELACLRDYEPAADQHAPVAAGSYADRARADPDPGRRVHDRRHRRRLRLRQRAAAAPHRHPRLPDRQGADHQRHLPHVRRGRRLRAPRVVDR